MTEIEEKKTLEILNQVRTMLSKAFEDESNCTPKSFSNPIATDYPIKPIKNQGDFKFHGWCEIETQGGWVRKLNVEKAKKFFIRNLFVQLLSENGSILPREILLPTFLHELSHTVTTPQKWQVNSIPNELREEGLTKSRCSTYPLVLGSWELSHVIFLMPRKKKTACKAEQIHKIIFTKMVIGCRFEYE